MQTVFLRQRLDSQLEGHDVVGSGQGICVLEIDLMLSGGNLMMAGLNFEAHLFQCHADFAAGAFPVIQGTEIEIACLVGGCGGWPSVLIRLEQEEFTFRSDVKAVSQVGGFFHQTLQRSPGISGEGRAVRVVHVADQAGDFPLLRAPGQNGERVQIRPQILIGFVDADKSLDGTSVNHDLVVDRFFYLTGGNGHVFQLAENVGELHTDEFHIVLFHHFNDIFF